MNDNGIGQQHLTLYGWNEIWEEELRRAEARLGRKVAPARVTAQFSHVYRVADGEGERLAEVSGKFAFEAEARSDYPVVGDWVATEREAGGERAVIQAVLPRRSLMRRKAAGPRVDEQAIGANLDTVFIVLSMNQDWNVRRIERYLIAIRDSGIEPVIVLTKADLDGGDGAAAFETEAAQAAPGVPVIAVSALADKGKERLAPYLASGRTVAATGSSGVGKSTLLNWLAGEDRQVVRDIREDDAKGRHTTTHRELFALPGGALWLDTPGMRELQLWDSQSGWEATFADIEALAANCRFGDCRHETESGCAVRAALEAGELDPSRLVNYRKTERELARLARKEKSAASRQTKQKTSRDRVAGKRMTRRIAAETYAED